MLNKIAGTAGSKIITALIGFLIISLNAKFLGVEAVGTIALIILGITISMLFSSLGGGAALVYLVPRLPNNSLYFPAIAWTFLSASIVVPLLAFIGWIPEQFIVEILILSILKGISNNHSTMLLGKERIHASNWLGILEIMVLLFGVAILYFQFHERSVAMYIKALVAAYGVNAFVGFFLIKKYLSGALLPSELWSSFKATIRYSFFIQSASFFQLMNYRLAFYFLEYFMGRGSVGIYSVGVKISESLWIISKSISTVQYARISNADDQNYSNNLTVAFFKVILVITVTMVGILLIIPESIYFMVFSSEFEGIKLVICGLSVGIISLACSMAFSGHFSGIGKQHLNMIGSLLGLFVTVAAGFLIIPELGLVGAAIGASISYTFTMLFYLIQFLRISKSSLAIFIPTRKDIELVRGYLSPKK